MSEKSGQHTFKIFQDSASINFYNGIKVADRWSKKQPHYPILNRVLNFMKDRGFQVGRDPRIEKHYKILTKDHWYGHKGDLEFKAERYPVGWKIEFFQNIVFENPHGGEHDFDKYEKMPYLIKLLFLNECRHIAELLVNLGYENQSKPVYKLSEDRIKEHIVTCTIGVKFKDPSEFNLGDYVCSSSKYSYNITDRDGKVIQNGQIKYIRYFDGRLRRGRVYHNINNMWWIVFNKFDYSNWACFELFDPTPEDYKARRLKKDRKPKAYLDRKEKLQEASTRELINELKRRGSRTNHEH
ncbi:hypothetical protein [Desulfosporosinus youngiae]|uniref:Uncharacterized protein n=1 Tax=Desulfosporosinus youngiae DSM 17734 TaxID=768710 RepID=H5Y254_9FIRM|nr:hypothetical protein [Desulfosporosinus youngiae]EHQ88252.1 hypothetical protein DesyoDRAFT_1081 [Desulfosporosinus youngiae DSM 17734]